MRLWTISALADELGQDRKALGRRLARLRPVEEKPRKDGRVERYYELADVLQHLNRDSNVTGFDLQEFAEAISEVVGGAVLRVCLTPGWVDELTSQLCTETGLSDEQAKRAIEVVVGAITRDLTTLLAAPDGEVLLPPEQ